MTAAKLRDRLHELYNEVKEARGKAIDECADWFNGPEPMKLPHMWTMKTLADRIRALKETP